ncbi:N-acetyltransferase [Croceicoccus ponticola]|uniref:N-acetyltransferase n=1 Tax=Croceicoccus ponticola TaxID=2217664 RepID=A0A437GY46_9SPHN|nr:GNAT family protein [Croceicoccus ponticola]RVQ67579.1 N-acetyltransferase [Croceicoccus ponticola]
MTADRVRLAILRPEDEADIIAANVASREYHTPWAAPCLDPTGFAAWLETAGKPNHRTLIARRTGDGTIAGVINFSQIALGNFRSAYLGYHGNTACSGEGLMTEAVRQAVDFAFLDIGLHRIEANIQPGNLRSIALVRRVGFRHEGFSPRYLMIDGDWRDHERWALTQEDWQK